MDHFTIYQITNLLDGKIYIGKHQTKKLDDGYMGSGKVLRHAIAKYGMENFKKEILYVFATESEMNAKEAELVNEEFVGRVDTYNICFGGHGGFGYINQNIQSGMARLEHNRRIAGIGGRGNKGRKRTDAERKAISEARKGQPSNFRGMKHSEKWKAEHSDRMKEMQGGSNNSQYGSMWITDGIESRKIKKGLDKIPEGWYKGRKLRTSS